MSADALARDQRIGLHRGLDGWIRNHLGLWKGNASLLEATGAPSTDHASLVIIEAVRPHEIIRDRISSGWFMRYAFLILLVLCSDLALGEDSAISSFFSAEGIDGTIVLKSLRGDRTITHNDERASRRFAPASTFKIFNTLIAVQENVVELGGTAFRWNGTAYEFPDWNRDQTLESAFKVSCVWCYQQVAGQVGEEAYRRYLALARYGVLAHLPHVTTFWLDGSLTVSAVEQIALLKKIYLRELPFRDDSYDALKQIMLAEQTDSYRLYAKTGWAARMSPQIGWYVGYVEARDDVWFFAINLTLRSDKDLGLRQKLTKAVLKAEGIIP